MKDKTSVFSFSFSFFSSKYDWGYSSILREHDQELKKAALEKVPFHAFCGSGIIVTIYILSILQVD